SWGRKNVGDRASIRTRARRQTGGVLLLCLACGRDLSSLIARLPCAVGREPGSESHALDCLDRNRRVVGHPVGPIYSIQSLITNFRGGKEIQLQTKPAAQAAKA